MAVLLLFRREFGLLVPRPAPDQEVALKRAVQPPSLQHALHAVQLGLEHPSRTSVFAMPGQGRLIQLPDKVHSRHLFFFSVRVRGIIRASAGELANHVKKSA
jgi:hypothetical protein